MTLKHWKTITDEEWPCRHFSPQELACRGSGMVLLTLDSIDAMQKLDRLRDRMGHPLICNSGYRSPQHNRNVKGAKYSKHLTGTAFDISMANVDPHRFEREAKALGFNGIGIYPPQKRTGAKNFIHIDTRPASQAWRGSEWGEFPAKKSRFTPEPEPALKRTAAKEVAVVGAVGVPAIEAAEQIEPVVREVAPWLPGEWQGYAYAALGLIGVALVVWRITRRSDA